MTYDKATVNAFLAGIVMIVLSLLMIPFRGDSMIDRLLAFFFRDVCMIWGLGVVFVSLQVEHQPVERHNMGFTKHKLWQSLVLNLLFASGLLAMFLKRQIPENLWNVSNLYAAVYVMTAGIFEMSFIYGYLRMSFERAFGVIPGIILTSAFYSLHHAGFQPEFLHLFAVGLMYCSVYYITRNLLIIFPFFWGVGALWDVIVSSDAGKAIKNLSSFVMALITIALSVVWIYFCGVHIGATVKLSETQLTISG